MEPSGEDARQHGDKIASSVGLAMAEFRSCLKEETTMRSRTLISFILACVLCGIQGIAQVPVFQDIAPSAGVDNSEMAMGAAFLDINNDGMDDIYLINDHQPGYRNFLYLNQGDSTFAEIGESAGVGLPEFPVAVRVGDIDNDGWQDLFVFTLDAHNMLYRNNQDNTFTDWLEGSPVSNQYLCAGDVGDVNNDGILDVYVVVRNFYNFYSILYQGYPHGEFAEVWRSNAPLWYGCDVQFCDFDNDGDQDILQGNMGTLNWLFQIDYPTMTEIAEPAGIAGYIDEFKYPIRGDFDNDGWMDVFSITFMEAGPSPHCLYRQDSPMHFFNRINSSGIDPLDTVNVGVAGDFDNDGWIDIVTVYQVTGVTRFWHNNQDGTFSEVASQTGLTLNNRETQGLAVGDINCDGFLDIYMVKYGSGNSANRLFLNGGNDNHWLQIALRGIESNGLGLGARVKAAAGDLVQWRDVGGGRWAMCSNAPYVHLGLGDHAVVDSVIVMWPSGRMQTLTNVQADQRITVTEGATSVHDPVQSKPAMSFRLLGAYPNPFNPTTTFSFVLPTAAQVQMIVYNVAGQKVATVVESWYDSGVHKVTFDGSGLASGVYFCRLQAGDYVGVQKMVLLK
jgi:hypothetical protein